MRMQGFMILVLTMLITSTACVLRSKHDATLAQLKDCQDERLSVLVERDAAVAQLEKQVGALSDEVQSTKTGAAARQAELEADVQEGKAQIAALNAQRARDARRLAAFQRLTGKFQKMIDAGEIKIYVRRGRMMVSLPSSVLFASGKAEVSASGQQALTRVATILKDFPKRRFQIAGHTDTVPIVNNDKFENNWTLSFYRAMAVTKFLIEQGVSSRNLAAAAYGEYDPVGNNKTPGGRQRNRRIEIVLMPNIDELPTIPK